jgi:predicted O-linked N-acetylglucosamine transferase (SPINDLY family)
MPTSSSPAHDFGQLVTQVWQHRLSFLQLVEHAEQLQASGNSPLAAVLYQTWLARGNAASAHFAAFNLGVLLFAGQDLAGAGKAYLQALEYKTDFHEARLNLALVLEHQADTNSACDQLRWIADHADATDPQQRPLLISALNNLGRMLERCKEYGPALGALDRSLALDPQQRDVLHHWVFIRQKQCLWPIYDHSQGFDPALMREATSALALLSLSDDPAAQLAAARQYAERKIPADLPALAAGQSYAHDKIRIAYCSSDFCLHPVSMLTVELFELHDRERFEVYGFCWSPEDGSALRQRVIQAFDHFIRIDTLDDDAAAQLIRKHEIDILIDLHGQTRGARPQMIARRPAPIQITYLGLPATTGLPAIDYVIADRFLIPEEYAHFYSEKPLYLPDVYQVSDRRRPCAEAPSRQECGLPDDAFVFCSLNNNHKYTPEVFACWMNILRRVPHSVLWLLADNRWAEENLRKEAEKHGIDSGRLLFAERVNPEQYLARYTAADLFLDTFPFNAGTTANDALWMGLPVLTLSGKSFASRMAGALLTAARLPELITENLQQYEDLAVGLANDAHRLAGLRHALATARKRGPLFNTPDLTRHLEAEFSRLQAELASSNSTKENIQHPAPSLLPTSILELVQEAEILQSAGQIDAAIAIYRQWLQGPDIGTHWIAHINLGILLKPEFVLDNCKNL